MTDISGADVMHDVGRRAAHSGVVLIVAQAVQLLMAIGSGVAMARLLAPADFGVMAMASTLTAFVMTFRGFGFSMAVVHAERIADDDLQRLFRVALRYTIWLGVGMLVAAPVLAIVYSEPRLTAVIVAVTAGSVAMSLAEFPTALAIRELRFTELRRVEIGSMAAGMALGLAAAWLGAGYWALVLQSAATELMRAVWSWQLVSWRPVRRDIRADVEAPRTSAADAMMHFASRYSATNIMIYAGQNIDRVTIGMRSGAFGMGVYDLAYRWGLYPVYQLYAPLLNVAVAGLSRTRDDATLYRHYWRTAILLVLSAMLPALAFFALEARPTILTLLGSGWTESIEVFRYVTIGGLALALSRHSRWLFLSEGRSTAQLRLSIVQLAVMACAVAIGVRWGVLGIAVAYAVARWVLLVPELSFAFADSPIGWRDYRLAVWRPATASALAGVALWAIDARLPDAVALRLAAGALVFGAVYVMAWLALPGGMHAMRELVGVAQRIRKAAA